MACVEVSSQGMKRPRCVPLRNAAQTPLQMPHVLKEHLEGTGCREIPRRREGTRLSCKYLMLGELKDLGETTGLLKDTDYMGIAQSFISLSW